MFPFLLVGLLMVSVKLASVTILQCFECIDTKIHVYNQVDGFLKLKYSVLFCLLCFLYTEVLPDLFRRDGHPSSMMVLPMSQIWTRVHVFCATCSLLTPLQRDIRLTSGSNPVWNSSWVQVDVNFEQVWGNKCFQLRPVDVVQRHLYAPSTLFRDQDSDDSCYIYFGWLRAWWQPIDSPHRSRSTEYSIGPAEKTG
jgi:hypothetical protein